jgi:hypothetical protein
LFYLPEKRLRRFYQQAPPGVMIARPSQEAEMRLIPMLLGAFLLIPGPVWACGVVASAAPHIIRASTAPEDGVTITFLGHASFEIETPATSPPSPTTTASTSPPTRPTSPP